MASKSVIRSAMLGALLCLGAAGARAQVFEGCVDANGREVASIQDASIPRVAMSGTEEGRPVLRYNPGALPRLSSRARLFFYAHECARIAAGDASGAAQPAQQAARADCRAVAMLQASDLVRGPDGVQALRSELRFSDAEWQQLPGPPREFALDACTVRGMLRMPAYAPASEAQMRFDRCAHQCGDALWKCQNRCSTAQCRGQCQATFDRCEAGCAGR